MTLIPLTLSPKQDKHTNLFLFLILNILYGRLLNPGQETASKNDLEFWGHSWLRHPVIGTAPGQIVKELRVSGRLHS